MQEESLKFVEYTKKEVFLKENLDLLLKNEIENEVLIGIVNEHEDIGDKLLLGRIEKGDDAQVIFAVDDKEGLVIYFTSDSIEDAVIEFLIENLLESKINIKQILVSSKYNDRVLNIYTKESNSRILINSYIDILTITEIEEQVLDENEKLIKVNPQKANIDKLVEVVKNIYSDIYKNEDCSDETAHEIVDIYLNKGIYILTDDKEEEIYSHAVTIRKQVHGCTLGAMFSPKENRGKGYGKKFIYNLCKKLLEDGNKFVILEAARQNYVARLVYERVGFKKVAELVRTFFY